MAKDYYVVLGIPRSESPEGIRSAYRSLVRQHHPDRAGPAGTPAFREVVEAYRVLSDPEQRRQHDSRLGRRVRVARARPPAPSAEPTRLDPRDVFANPESIRPSAEALFEHVLRNLTAAHVAKGEHAEPLLCDVALNAAEAQRGGVLPIRIPVARPCPPCQGSGATAGLACGACAGRGGVPGELVVPLHLPPGLPSGSVVETSLEPWGLRNLWLRARIAVHG